MVNEFGTTLRRLRKDARMTQAGLAAALGVSRVYIAQLEGGAVPGPDQAARIAALLGARAAERVRLVLLALDRHEPESARLLRWQLERLAELVHVTNEVFWLNEYWEEARLAPEGERRELLRAAVEEAWREGTADSGPMGAGAWNALVNQTTQRLVGRLGGAA
jgi:transcriptional regulator with XRE-family HTH domain